MASLAIHFNKDLELESIALGGKAYNHYDKDQMRAIMCSEMYLNKGLSGMFSSGNGMEVYPSGSLKCPCCKQLKLFDMHSPAVSTYDHLGNVEYESFICSDCADDFMSGGFRMQYGSLFHSENCNDLRDEAVKVGFSMMVSQWRRHVAIKKNRREMARSVCLVAARVLKEAGSNHGVGPVLASVLSQYDTEHCLLAH